MKRFIMIAVMALACGATTFAQSTTAEMKERIDARNAAVAYTEKQLNTKVLKEAKKEAKAKKKEGWVPATGSLTLEKQLTNVYTKQYMMDGNFPRYIIGRGIAQSSTPGMARKHALARARVDIINQMAQEVTALTESTESTTELTKQEIETIAKMVETSNLLSQQSLGKTDVIYEAHHKIDAGTEVEVIVTYEGKSAMQLLLKSFNEDEAEIKVKLETLMQKLEITK